MISSQLFKPLPGPLESALRCILPEERFRWSLAGSTLLHVVLILGVGFTLPRIADPEIIAPMLVTLVSSASNESPEKAEFLAQANYLGAGNSGQPKRATSSQPLAGDWRFSMLSYETDIPGADRSAAAAAQTLLTVDESQDARPAKQKTELSAAQTESTRLRTIRDQLLADLDNARRKVQQGLREKYLGSRAKESKYAQYMEQWRANVEEIGNLNYPDEARRKRLSGSLVLDVGIRPDGEVDSISVARSSGNKVLDDAAERIVRLASPFAPFPESFRSEVDVLHMVRTWEFLHDRLRSE